MKLIIDRFEGNFAVCETENKTFVNIPKSELPSLINEGDVLIQNADGKYSLRFPVFIELRPDKHEPSYN